MSISSETLGAAKRYVRESLLGGGAVVGKNVTISSVTPIAGGNRVTFSYTLDNGTVKTSTMDVMDGKDGVDGTNGKNGKDGQPGKDGSDGIGISKIEKIGTVDLVDTYRITFTDNSTFDYEVKNGKDGQGGGGTVDAPIESISVNGVNVEPDANKNVDITVPTKTSDLSNDSGFLTEHQDISGKVDKVDGKSLIADSEITRLASVDNYDDTAIKNSIKTVANGLMDSVGYSADYKSIDIIAKNGVKKSVNVAPIISHASITELSDVDTTNKATGKALVYNATTSKHEYADVSGTDEKVKMDASTDAKYLGELLDNVTITNENGELKVKKLDGQEVTITEINYLKGLTMNVMDLVNMFSNGGVKIINTPVATYAELLTIDKSAFIEGISYLVYVLADENHDNAKTTYLVDKDSETPTYFGFADSQRDFTTNPIDLATEITGKLGIANMDSDAIKALFTVDDTYKTATATNNAFSTHGAKALYDELLLAIGNKANDSDLTAHKDDTNIHVTADERTKWNDTAMTVRDETVKKTDMSTTIDENSTDDTIPTSKAIYDTINDLKTNFQDGVNTIYDAVVARGVTPVDKSPSSIAEAIANLGVIEYIENLIPTMTSNTSPSGLAFADNEVVSSYGCYAWRAFDGKTNINSSSNQYNLWASANTSNAFIGYRFDTPTKVTSLSFVGRYDSASNQSPKTVKVQYSDDNSTWYDATDVISIAAPTVGTMRTDKINIDNSSYHLYWRLFTLTIYGGSASAVVEMQMSGYKL